MIGLEIIENLNKYNNSVNIYEKKQIENSLLKLISENKTDFLTFVQTKGENFDETTKKYLQYLYDKTEHIEENITKNSDFKISDDNSFEYIKNKFKIIKQELIKNNGEGNNNCEIIIMEIINKYIENDFETLRKILEVKDDIYYDKFKNLLNNYIRKYYSDKINNYMKSEKFNQLSFINKWKKKNQVYKIINEMKNYKFNQKKIGELFKNG